MKNVPFEVRAFIVNPKATCHITR